MYVKPYKGLLVASFFLFSVSGFGESPTASASLLCEAESKSDYNNGNGFAGKASPDRPVNGRQKKLRLRPR